MEWFSEKHPGSWASKVWPSAIDEIPTRVGIPESAGAQLIFAASNQSSLRAMQVREVRNAARLVFLARALRAELELMEGMLRTVARSATVRS